MTTTKNYDNLNRLTSIHSGTGVSPVAVFDYQYNSANQRTRRTEADNSYWDYTYDSLGQVTSGQKKWADGTPVAGQQFGYQFDTIGNRKSAVRNSRSEMYTVNALNQYTQRTVPGAIDILGAADSNATVTVNNQPTSRKGEYFHTALQFSNTPSAIYTNVNIVGVRKNAGASSNDVVTQVTGHEFIPQSPETFGYDSDGNLTNDGRWAYSWDAENRLVSMETDTSKVGAASVPRQKLLFTYDSQSRRISKVVSNWTSGSWLLTSDSHFVYDSWNLIAELDSTNGLVRSYTWGLDLSGSMQGAGGIGGLIAANLGTNGTHFVAFDGNGNVAAFVDASSGTVSGNVDYDPFGGLLRKTGAALACPIDYSTKYRDHETDLLYYGFRYLGKQGWPSRDPIEEEGGANLYAFVANDPSDRVDPLGLAEGTFDVSFIRSWHDTDVSIVYKQNKKPCCEKLRIVQIARGADRPDWFIDWLKDKVGEPNPYYPYQTYACGVVGMWDSPGKSWGSLRKYWQEFETCALSINSPNGNVLGCVKWGHAFSRTGRLWDYGEGKGQAAIDPSWAFMNAINGIKFP